MSKNINKKRLIGQIVLTSIFGIIIIGVSFAIFLAKASGGLENITTKKLVDVTYSETSTLRLTSNIPIFESEIESKATEFNFKVTNPNSSMVYATIELTDINMSPVLKSYDFKWALYNGSIKKATGTFIDGDTTITLINNNHIKEERTKNYTIRLWIEETGEVQNFSGASFSAKVKVTAYSRPLRTLTNRILGKDDSNIVSDTCNFSNTSTDKGLYTERYDTSTTKYGFPTYYYRGNVENNYVQLGTYKSDVTNKVFNGTSQVDTVVAKSGDPILWRIVRINEDGSVRLIAQYNTGTSIAFDSMSPYSSNYTNSNIETELNNWYNTNISRDTNINNIIVTGTFCNDISNNYSAVYKRIWYKNPIFTCPNGANIINSKVGLITADEMMYSGSLYQLGSHTYMYNSTWFWTISPFSSTQMYYNTAPEGVTDLSSDSSNSSYGSRPVINIRGDVLTTKGNGTKTNPYIIKVD